MKVLGDLENILIELFSSWHLTELEVNKLLIGDSDLSGKRTVSELVDLLVAPQSGGQQDTSPCRLVGQDCERWLEVTHKSLLLLCENITYSIIAKKESFPTLPTQNGSVNQFVAAALPAFPIGTLGRERQLSSAAPPSVLCSSKASSGLSLIDDSNMGYEAYHADGLVKHM